MKVIRNFRGIRVLTQKAQELLPYTLAVGQVISVPDATTREVKVLKMEMNDYLKMYFNKSFQLTSVDEKNQSQLGDIVLIKKLLEPPTKTKLFGVDKVLFATRNIVDPITGRSNSHETNLLKEHLEKFETKV